MNNDHCQTCDVFYDDPKVPDSDKCKSFIDVCRHCYCVVCSGIIDVSLGRQTEALIHSKKYDKDNWWLEDSIQERREEVFRAQNFKMGDMVVIVREENSFTKGWGCLWDTLMNRMIGGIFNIEAVIDNKSIYIMNGAMFSFPWWVVRHEAEAGTLQTNINNLFSCPRCKGNLIQKTSLGFSGQSMVVNKCEACGYCN